MPFEAEFTSDIPEHTIDLGERKSRRWRAVAAAEEATIRRLVRTGWEEIEREIEWAPGLELLKLVLPVYGLIYRRGLAVYKREVVSIAKQLDLDLGQLALLQNMYSLAQIGDGAPPEEREDPAWCLANVASDVAGCTAGLTWVEGLGMVHLRTLDWGMRNIGYAIADGTRLFHFVKDDPEKPLFTLVGLPGHATGFSGIAPGRFSLTINFAPQATPTPFFFKSPETLLREVMEKCGSYAEARDMILHTELSAGAFFTLCGVEKGEGCVIECARVKEPPEDYVDLEGPDFVRAVREFDPGVGYLVQSNHYV